MALPPLGTRIPERYLLNQVGPRTRRRSSVLAVLIPLSASAFFFLLSPRQGIKQSKYRPLFLSSIVQQLLGGEPAHATTFPSHSPTACVVSPTGLPTRQEDCHKGPNETIEMGSGRREEMHERKASVVECRWGRWSRRPESRGGWANKRLKAAGNDLAKLPFSFRNPTLKRRREKKKISTRSCQRTR